MKMTDDTADATLDTPPPLPDMDGLPLSLRERAAWIVGVRLLAIIGRDGDRVRNARADRGGRGVAAAHGRRLSAGAYRRMEQGRRRVPGCTRQSCRGGVR